MACVMADAGGGAALCVCGRGRVLRVVCRAGSTMGGALMGAITPRPAVDEDDSADAGGAIVCPSGSRTRARGSATAWVGLVEDGGGMWAWATVLEPRVLLFGTSVDGGAGTSRWHCSGGGGCCQAGVDGAGPGGDRVPAPGRAGQVWSNVSQRSYEHKCGWHCGGVKGNMRSSRSVRLTSGRGCNLPGGDVLVKAMAAELRLHGGRL